MDQNFNPFGGLDGDRMVRGMELDRYPIAGGFYEGGNGIDGDAVPTIFWANTGSGTDSRGTRMPESGATTFSVVRTGWEVLHVRRMVEYCETEAIDIHNLKGVER